MNYNPIFESLTFEHVEDIILPYIVFIAITG